jgi:uncharacterized membrane protein YkoI
MNIRMAVAIGGMLAASAIAAETKVKLEELPAPVQETVRNETKGITLVGVSKEAEKGKTLYEVEMKSGNKIRTLMLDAAGKITAVEEEIDINAVPAAAREVIEKKAAGGQIKRVEMVMSPGKLEPFYEATIEMKGKSSELAVNANGSHHK